MTMQAYLINLPRDTDRMAVMTAQLAQLGLAFERVPAVYGRDLSPEQRAALYDPALNQRQYHQPLVDGEIGCYASHLQIWQRMHDNAVPCALVLEDDVLLKPALVPVLQAIAALPRGWDMVKLIGRDAEQPWQHWPLSATTDLIRYRRVPSLTSGYVISGQGAAKLLAHRRPFGRPVDIDLRHWWECDLRVFGAYPYPVCHGQAGAQSSISGRDHAGGAAWRWRKFRAQLHYTLAAWGANWRHRADHAPGRW